MANVDTGLDSAGMIAKAFAPLGRGALNEYRTLLGGAGGGGGGVSEESEGSDFNLDPVVRAVALRESSNNPNAIGKAGELGLMQILPSTARGLGITNPRDLLNPETNLATGKKYLKQLLDRYHGDLPRALAAYNAGARNVDRGRIPSSTRSYVDNILNTLKGWGVDIARPEARPDWMLPPGDGGATQPPAVVGAAGLPLMRSPWAPAARPGPSDGLPMMRSPWSLDTEPSPRGDGLPMMRSPWAPPSPDSNVLEIPSRMPSGAGGNVLEIPSRMPAASNALASGAPSNTLEIPSRFPPRFARGAASAVPSMGGVMPSPLRINPAQAFLPGGAPPVAAVPPMSLGARVMGALGPTAAYADEPPSDEETAKYLGVSPTPTAPAPTDEPPSDEAAEQAMRPPRWVEFADWLPMIMQTGGELGGIALAAGMENPVAAPALATAGGAGGDVLGEEMRNWIRNRYGYPGRTGKEVLASGAWSGLGSLIGQPTGRVVREIAQPVTYKAGKRAVEGMEAAEQGVQKVGQAVDSTLGIPKAAAQRIATTPSMRQGAQDAYHATRAAGYNRLSGWYQALLRPYLHRLTPGSGKAVLQSELTYDPTQTVLRRLWRDWGGKRPTVAVMHAFRTEVRAERASLNPQTERDLIRVLSNIERGTTRDLETVLNPQEAQRLKQLDRHWSDFNAQYPAAQVRAVRRAPNSPQVMEEILKGKSSQIETMVNELGHLPPTARKQAEVNLRKAVASYVHNLGAHSGNELEGLQQIEKNLDVMPPRLFNFLYGPKSKESLLKTVRGVIELNERFLKEPGLREAVEHEMEHAPMPWLMRHAWFEVGAATATAIGGAVTGHPAVGGVTAFWLGLPAMHHLLNNPATRKMYAWMLTGNIAKLTPAQIAAGFGHIMRAAMAAEGSEQAKQLIMPEETGRDQP